VPDRTPLALAALACAAVGGLEPVSAQTAATHGVDLDVAVVTDDLARRWLVRSPRTQAAGVRLEQEGRLLAALAGWLPFAVPDIAGTATLPEGGRAVVHRSLPGEPVGIEALPSGPGPAGALGRALAAIHDLPVRVVEDAGMATYGAEEFRLRRLAEVDRAAATGHVPAALLGRWEKALEEVGAWRFVPCVVHGDLAAENVLVEAGDVSGVLEWGETRVADPADDLAWLVAGAPDGAVATVLEAYAGTRRTPPDRDLARRARLSGELALARWLLHGTGSDDAAVVDDAVAMLGQLDAAVAGVPW
jgi:macrolide phosphotransferase